MSFFEGTFSSPSDTAEGLRTYFDEPDLASKAHLMPLDLIVPMGLTPASPRYNKQHKPLFPVKIDSGFGGVFHISLKHFYEWARWREPPRRNGSTEYLYINRETEDFDTFAGTLWLPNTENSEQRKLPLGGGFTICTELTLDGDPIPRIPVVGQRVLRTAGVILTIDYFRRAFGINFAKK